MNLEWSMTIAASVTTGLYENPPFFNYIKPVLGLNGARERPNLDTAGDFD